MKFQFVFGFILLIIFVVIILVGVPYLLKNLKPLDFSGFFKLSTSTPSYYVAPSQQSYPAPTQEPKGEINISSVSYSGQAQRITLRTSYFSGGAVDITGWKIKSLQKGEIVIGKGSSLPQFFGANSDIELGSGESADIFTGPSPLLINFRANNCFGWLADSYNIGYSLNYCPRFALGDLWGLDSVCQELILRNNNCQPPSADVLNKYTGACRLWVEKNMNYNACVLKHKDDSDFFKGWQIYTGNYNQIVDPLHDKIELRDQAGLLMDNYEY